MKSRTENRRIRHARVRQKVSGTAERPRLAIMVSNRRISAQLVDDTVGRTLASAVSSDEVSGRGAKAAECVGRRVAERALAIGIFKMSVDRGGFQYGNRIKALVDAAEAVGLMARREPAKAEGGDEAQPLEAVSADDGKEN